MFKEYIKPLIVLTGICLFFSAALALVNSVTEPVIAEAAGERAFEAMRSILPEATGFEAIELEPLEGIPAAVREAYRTENGVGYVFIASATGYGGEISLICAMDNDGRIIKVQTLSHTETVGIGTIIEDELFLAPFISAGHSLDGVDTITGATVSTRAFIGAVEDVFIAYEVISGIR